MATLNQAVQSMIDNLHQKMISDTPLSAEEQTLVAKALEALRNNYTWEQALVAVAEHHINESKQALIESEQNLTDKMDELIANYSIYREVGGGSFEIRVNYSSDTRTSRTITPPPNCRIKITYLTGYRYGYSTICLSKSEDISFRSHGAMRYLVSKDNDASISELLFKPDETFSISTRATKSSEYSEVTCNYVFVTQDPDVAINI